MDTKSWYDYRNREQLSVKELGEEGLFAGYAAVFDNVDLQNERIQSGAFKRTLHHKGARFPVLWSHNPEEVIGILDNAQEDDHGLKVDGRLVLQVQRAKDVHALVHSGAVTGFSIGYRVIKDDWDATHKIRNLKELDLFEVSICAFPANSRARIRHMKHTPFEDAAFEERDIFVGPYLVGAIEDGTAKISRDAVLACAAELWGMNAKADRPPAVVQTIIFDKEKFTLAEARAWLKEHDFRSSGVDETEDTYRFRQRDPGDFIDGSFRTIEFAPGIQAVVGRLKPGKIMLLDAWREEVGDILRDLGEPIPWEYAPTWDEAKRALVALNPALEDTFGTRADSATSADPEPDIVESIKQVTLALKQLVR